MLIPRENTKSFVDAVSENYIELGLDFYNICRRCNLDVMTFHGFPWIKAGSIKENNDTIIEIIFAENPIEVCRRYNLKQVLALLKKSNDPKKFWEENTPCIGVLSNPERI